MNKLTKQQLLSVLIILMTVGHMVFMRPFNWLSPALLILAIYTFYIEREHGI